MLKGVLGWGLGLAATGVGAVAGVVGWQLNGRFRPWPPYTFSPYELQVPWEDVDFRADDGVALAGWVLPREDAKGIVVCCHGRRGNKADMLGISAGLWRAGYEVLLFDFRGNGSSGDGPQSLGFHEQRDFRAAVDLVAARRPDLSVAAVGFSMGAATAILAGARDPRVRAFVLDSPFATMSDVVAANLAANRLPRQPFTRAADLVNRIGFGYGYEDVRPIDAIRGLPPRPTLLMHGTDDSSIPFEHALRLADEVGRESIEFVAFQGADHCGGYFQDRPGYVKRVADFLDRAVG